jgi:hypothetical protein
MGIEERYAPWVTRSGLLGGAATGFTRRKKRRKRKGKGESYGIVAPQWFWAVVGKQFYSIAICQMLRPRTR